MALSATGEEQARALGTRRRDDDLAAVLCSDFKRAVRTAKIAFGDRNLPIVQDARLRECDYGTFTRRPVSEIEERRVDHLAHPFPDGESYEDVVRREHLTRRIPLRESTTSTWRWQPAWTYRVTKD